MWTRARHLTAVLTLAAVSCSLTLSFAHGQDLDDARARATAKHHEAVAAFGKHRYQKSIELSEEAEALLPSPANAYNIARAYERMNDTAHALSWYRDYLRRAPTASDRGDVERTVDKLAKQLAATGVQQVTIVSKPAGALAWIDDVAMGATPWTGELPPGTHQARVTFGGYQDRTRPFVLTLEAPMTLDVTLELAREEAPIAVNPAKPLRLTLPENPISLDAPTPRSTPREATPTQQARAPAAHRDGRSSDSGSGLRTAGIVSIAGGAASLGGAVAFEILRRSAESDARNETQQIAYANDVSKMEDRQAAARVLAAIGGAATLGGVVLLVFAANADDKEKPPAPKADLAVGCLLGGCKLTLKGTY